MVLIFSSYFSINNLLRYNIISQGRQSQYRRGRGSYKEGVDKSHTPEKGGQKSSFKTKKNINFDPK